MNKIDLLTNGFAHCTQKLNKRLSRVILYGKRAEDLVDRRTILQRCVEEIGRVRDNDKSELGLFEIWTIFEKKYLLLLFSIVSIPKVMLLYGGDTENVEPIYRLLNAEIDRRKFGLVIIRV